MRRKKRFNVNRTDLRLPGQPIVIDGQLSSFHDLMGYDPDMLSFETASDKPNLKLVKSSAKNIPSDDETDGWVNFSVSPQLRSKIAESAPGVFKRARSIIMRIGRPRQP